jgi:hypothetical protein
LNEEDSPVDYDMSTTDPAVGGSAGPSQTVGWGLRIASQVIGLILILAGAYYALWLVVTAVSYARNPAEMATAVESMAAVLNLQEAAVPVGETKIHIGRTVGGVLLAMWYLLTGAIALGLVSGGGKLVLGVIGERREFLAAMKEFLVTFRTEGAQHTRKSI